jgi:uncharacterized linocin/CFP29 family protein
MADFGPQLPWTTQQWADLRAAAMESARRARVASTFLPLVGPTAQDQATVPSLWTTTEDVRNPQLGEASSRLQVRAGKTLHLVTTSCNVYLRGSEVVDPDLSAAKALVRRAAEILGRLEDAVVFHGRPPDGEYLRFDDRRLVVEPLIYTITGGRDLTGLLQAPDTHFRKRVANGAESPLTIRSLMVGLQEAREKSAKLDALRRNATSRKASAAARRNADAQIGPAKAEKEAADARVRALEVPFADLIMCVRVGGPGSGGKPIVETIIDAIQKLERQGHFGPFAVALGHKLFSLATTPTGSLVLPTDRLAEFLDGRRVTRSGILPPDDGVVVALGGEPIELVLARDVDIAFLQVTLEPRYVLRVFERFVLRIKELDAVCRVTMGPTLLDPRFEMRGARS